MPDYLISRPGRPLHLTVAAYDAPSSIVRWIPLCGQDRGREWRITGPWAEKWPEHQRGGLCLHCREALANLLAAADEAPRGAR